MLAITISSHTEADYFSRGPGPDSGPGSSRFSGRRSSKGGGPGGPPGPGPGPGRQPPSCTGISLRATSWRTDTNLRQAASRPAGSAFSSASIPAFTPGSACTFSAISLVGKRRFSARERACSSMPSRLTAFLTNSGSFGSGIGIIPKGPPLGLCFSSSSTAMGSASLSAFCSVSRYSSFAFWYRSRAAVTAGFCQAFSKASRTLWRSSSVMVRKASMRSRSPPRPNPDRPSLSRSRSLPSAPDLGGRGPGPGSPPSTPPSGGRGPCAGKLARPPNMKVIPMAATAAALLMEKTISMLV